MSVEFRQRSVGELLKMLWRQKWTILLPALAMAAAFTYVVWKLPKVYESKTLLTITPPKILSPDSYSSEAINQRLTGMQQEIMSRSSLEPMILKYNLFKAERGRGAAMEEILEKMTKNIKIELEKTDDLKVSSFSIAYKDTNPENARAVTSDLAGKFVNRQLENSKITTTETKDFYEKRVQDVLAKKAEIEKRKLDIMIKNSETLPESAQGLIARLESLRSQQNNISTQKTQLNNEKGRLTDRLTFIDRQKDLLEETYTKEAESDAKKASDVTQTQTYAELIKRRGDLNTKLQNLLKVYRPAHPDVQETKTAIEVNEKQIAELSQKSDQGVAAVRESAEAKKTVRLKSLDIEKEQVRGEIGRIEAQIANQERQSQVAEEQSAAIQARLESVPNVKIALEAVDKDLSTVNDEYTQLVQKTNLAEDRVAMRDQNIGEAIKVVDPANLPESPTNNTKRLMLCLIGLGSGLALGLILATAFELPGFFTIQNLEDAKHYTNLPVLAAVPQMLTPQEARRRWGLGFLRLTVGAAIAIGAIPLVIIVLEKLRILDKFAL